MILSQTQALKTIQNPISQEELDKSLAYESELRTFTESKTLEQLGSEIGWTNFVNELVKSVKQKKASRILDFTSYPLPFIGIADNINKDVQKVFDAKNAFAFVSSEDKAQQEFIEKNNDSFNVFNFIKANGEAVLKNDPNSCVIVDYDEDFEPFLIYLRLERIIDIKLKNDQGELHYITFLHSRERIGETEDFFEFYGVYDDSTYWVFKSKNGDKEKIELVSENPNFAKVCPARMFLSHSLNGGIDREIPLSNSLGSVKDWQRFQIMKTYTDHYFPFPVIERIENDCSATGCENGVINEEREVASGEDVVTKVFSRKCEICNSSDDHVGPGFIIDVPAQLDKDDPKQTGGFRFITPDVKSLVYIGDRNKETEKIIKLNTVGFNELLKNEAVNKDQVKGSFESKTNVLLRLSENFNILFEWITTIIYKGKFESTLSIDISVSYGTEFYVFDNVDLQKAYDDAKKSGFPESEIQRMFFQFIENKYKGNPDEILRHKMIYQLDPLPLDNWDAAQKKFDSGFLNNVDFSIKTYFSNFIARFEREQGSITKFGFALPMEQRINNIYDTLKTYSNDKNSNGDPEE